MLNFKRNKTSARSINIPINKIHGGKPAVMMINKLNNGRINNHVERRRGASVRLWKNLRNVGSSVRSYLWSNKNIQQHSFGNNGTSEQSNRGTGFAPRKPRLADKVAMLSCVGVLWLLALNILPKSLGEGTDVNLYYYAIEFGLYAFLSAAITLYIFVRSHWAFTAMTFLAFSNTVWFGWAMITKVNMLITDTYSYVGFSDTGLHDKILASVGIGFVGTIFLKLWKHRRSLKV